MFHDYFEVSFLVDVLECLTEQRVEGFTPSVESRGIDVESALGDDVCEFQTAVIGFTGLKIMLELLFRSDERGRIIRRSSEQARAVR